MDEDNGENSPEPIDHDSSCASCGHTVERECRFGTPCGVPITDVSIPGLERHFLRYHAEDLSRTARPERCYA